MKKLLLIMPNYYGFDDVVINGLKKYSNCEVYNINYDVGFKYENLGQRIGNFLSKIFLNKNRKPLLKKRYFEKLLLQSQQVDYLIINRPDILPDQVLEVAFQKSDNTILLLWDSLEKVSIDQGVIKRFSKVFSFDVADCLKYGYEKIDNFHFANNNTSNNVSPEFDALFLGTVDGRMNDLEKVLIRLNQDNRNAHAFLHRPKGRYLPSYDYKTMLSKIVPFQFSETFAKRTKVIIDLKHNNQIGLSFRFFEAIILQKKVITTNRHVEDYDFYNPDNIFIIDDIDSFDIPLSFWENEYRPLPDKIVHKYSVESWVKTILN